MISFSNPVELDKKSFDYSSVDLAALGNIVVAAWTHYDDELHIQGIRADTRELGPMVTLTAFDCHVSKVIETDSEIWMLVQMIQTTEARLAKLTVDPETLEIALEWRATIPLSRTNAMWMMRYRNRIIVAGNCGNPGDPSDPSNYLYSQMHMFDFDGTLIDQAAAMVQSGSYYTEWLDTVTVNPWTSELLGLSAIYSGGYHESIWTMPITEAGFGAWTRRNDLYNDWARWAVGIGTPDGWHFVTCPNGPRYAEIISIDTATNRRGSALLAHGGAVDSWFDEEHSKVCDIGLRNGRVFYACHEWGYSSPGYEYGLVLGYGNPDSPQPLTEVTHIPNTSQRFVTGSVYNARVTGTDDGWMYLGGLECKTIPKGFGDAYRHYVWGASPEADHFPEPVVLPELERANFRRPL